MTLMRRLKKLEAGTRDYIILFVPDGLSWEEREAFIEAHRRENGIQLDSQVIALDEADRGL